MILAIQQGMSKSATSVLVRTKALAPDALRSEMIRKGIHFLSALVPTIAAFDRSFTLFALAIGTIFYTLAEASRLRGVPVPVVSRITQLASRERDSGHFVLGPVTLALGVMLALLLYPAPAASIAIYALAFGDGVASLVGRTIGRMRPQFLGGKSIEGSLACFLAVLFAAYRVSGRLSLSLSAALVATLTEAVPLADFDNIVLPLIVGWVVLILL